MLSARSTAGGLTSTTWRLRSAFTRASIVKGQDLPADANLWRNARQRSHPPMTEGLSPTLQHLETSATIAVSAEAKRRKAAGEDVVDLGAGVPDSPTPSTPPDAGTRAIQE